MAKGEVIGCFGLTEPDFGSNPSGMITMAQRAERRHVDPQRQQDVDHERFDGADRGRVGEDERRQERSSIRGFIVPTDSKGFKSKDQKGKLSLRASDTSELVFQDVRASGGRAFFRSRVASRVRSCASRKRATGSRGARSARRWRASRKRSSTRRRA